MWRLGGAVAIMKEYARACVCVRGARGVFLPDPELPICILMSLAFHIKLLQLYFSLGLCFQECYTKRGMKDLKKYC